MKKLFLFLISFCLFFLSGCATSYYVSVDSIGNADKSPYYIYPGEGDENDLNYQEYSHYVKNAFKLNGMEVCENLEDANTVVFLFYSISDPKKNVASYSMPTFGQTGVSSSTTTGTFIGNTYTSTTTYAPSYGITGATTTTEVYNTYIRNIALWAYDLPSCLTNKPIQLWKTEIISEGRSGDLREVFPYLIAASYKHFGKNTEKRVNITFPMNSPEVELIKQ